MNDRNLNRVAYFLSTTLAYRKKTYFGTWNCTFSKTNAPAWLDYYCERFYG
ncbi:hypothetical protein [Niabella hibiscisoli]|uniref:hypothetical protein n=1 Tax=Niabella hibiscisoli TaxID=1825928 RepID=UPI001F0DF79A|nr:hypothetical protein [Niabella hibiscisoli]MCH5719601.1 hypothetical protein [Niabella hibiscisoli]